MHIYVRTRVLYVSILFPSIYFCRVKKSFSAYIVQSSIAILCVYLYYHYFRLRRELRHIVGDSQHNVRIIHPILFFFFFDLRNIHTAGIEYTHYTYYLYIYTRIQRIRIPTLIYVHCTYYIRVHPSQRVCICLLVFHSVFITFFPSPFLYHTYKRISS